MTNLDLSVLRAMARLSRKQTRATVSCESIALRVDGSLEDVRAALLRLSRASLVDLSANLRLTMAGLAVAVASGAAVVRKNVGTSPTALPRALHHRKLVTSRRAA